MLKLIAKLLFAGALASSYSYISYADDTDSDEMSDAGGDDLGDSDVDATPGAETKPAAPAEKPAATATAKAKTKEKKAGKNKKMAAKKH